MTELDYLVIEDCKLKCQLRDAALGLSDRLEIFLKVLLLVRTANHIWSFRKWAVTQAANLNGERATAKPMYCTRRHAGYNLFIAGNKHCSCRDLLAKVKVKELG